MATQQSHPHSILADIAADFAALVQLMERAIESLTPHETSEGDIEALRRAKDAAERAANLATGNLP